MGVEKGSVIIYEHEYYLFAGYGSNEDLKETYILHGMGGVVIEPLADKCTFLIAPSEMRV